MNLNLKDSVVMITGSDSSRFGTGFVIHKEENATYILTCTHVINMVGREALQVDEHPAQVLDHDTEQGFDLAVLLVERVMDFPVLQLQVDIIKSRAVITAGYYEFGKQRVIQELTGALDKEIVIHSQNLKARGPGWRLKITDSDALQPGYSGAPIIGKDSGRVLGVVNQRKGKGAEGLAVSIGVLEMIWPDMPPNLLQKQAATMADGYLSQAEPFMNLGDELAAFERIATGQDTETRLILVHGNPGMGKSYLLDLYREVADAQHLGILDIALGPQISVIDCLERMVSHYGWQRFPSYEEAASTGEPKPLTRTSEEQWWRTLTRKFFLDLENHAQAPRLAAFFDPYEKADYAFKNWISRVFLPNISTRFPIIVIIAGREEIAPVPSGRICRHFHLNGVTADWYHRYVRACNAPVDPGEVDSFYEALKGEPKRFVELVKSRLSVGGAG